jgi:hypothetical protein
MIAVIMNSKMQHIIKQAIVILLLLLSVVACKTPRSIIKAPLKNEGEQFLLTKMASAEMRYNYFNAKVAITLIDETKSKTNLSGQVRIKKDSIIWISLSPALGIEAARLVLTTDSIKFINRLDKSYFTGDYNFINQYFGTTIDYDMVQALITGNDLESYEDENFRASVDNLEYKLSATNRFKRKKFLKQKDTPNVLIQNIWLNPETFKIMKINMKEYTDENKRLQAAYTDFNNVNGQLVPFNVFFELHGGKKMDVNLSFTRLELDTEQTFPFKIPENFSKMK